MSEELKNANDNLELNDEALHSVTGGLGEITSNAIDVVAGSKDCGSPNIKAPLKSNTFFATKSRK